MNKTTASNLPTWLQDLLKRMDEEMVLRGFTRETRRVYAAHVRRFYEARAAASAPSPEGHAFPGPENTGSSAPEPAAENEEVREWLLHLFRSGQSHSYANQALSALRFLHRKVLHAPAPVADIPRAKRKKTLPKILSQIEIKAFLAALRSPKHRAIAMILYSGGLRVSEAARLKVEDIDSHRGQIHVRQGKGRKDRYVMLSPVVLEVLREYARVERPHDWLFPAGHRRDRHITPRTIQKEVSRAARDADIQKRVTPHMLRHNAVSRIMLGGIVEDRFPPVPQPLLV